MDIRQIVSFFTPESVKVNEKTTYENYGELLVENEKLNEIHAAKEISTREISTRENNTKENNTKEIEDTELVAVIMAAISALEKVPQEAFVVRSIKRRRLQQ